MEEVVTPEPAAAHEGLEVLGARAAEYVAAAKAANTLRAYWWPVLPHAHERPGGLATEDVLSVLSVL